MSNGSNKILNLRRSARYTVDRPDDVSVQLRYRLHGTVEELSAELADVSFSGIRLRTSVAVPIKENVQVQLSLPAGAVDIPLDGEVCWARPQDEHHWWLGISLATAIPDGVLDQLAAHEIVDRRRERRLTIAADATARFELGSETFPVKVLDLSQGGFSLLAPQPGQVGDRLSLIADPSQLSSPPVLGRICWTREEGGQYVYGCEFITSSAAATLRAGLAECGCEPDDECTGTDEQTLPVTRRSWALLAGIACIAMLTCLQMGDLAEWIVPADSSWPVGTQPSSAPSKPMRGAAEPKDLNRVTQPVNMTDEGSQAAVPAVTEFKEHPLIPVLRRGFEQLHSWWPDAAEW